MSSQPQNAAKHRAKARLCRLQEGPGSVKTNHLSHASVHSFVARLHPLVVFDTLRAADRNLLFAAQIHRSKRWCSSPSAGPIAKEAF